VEQAKKSRARQIVERLELTPDELERLTRVLHIVRDTLDPAYRAQVSAVAQELNKVLDRLEKRPEMSPDDVQNLTQVLRATLDTLNPEYRTNIAGVARQLGKSRRTIYNWVDRVLEATVAELREIRVGRPSKRRAGSG
jgi:ABC-type transporter Mla subunit MlaD